MPGSGADVTIPSGKTAVIGATTTADCNNLTVGGSLTIESSGAGTGSLIVSGTVSGNATVQRYVTLNAWHLVAPPALGQSVGEFLTANTIISENPSIEGQRAMKTYNEGTNLWNALLYDNSTDNMATGRGFAVWPNSNGTVSFTGGIQSGNRAISVVRSGLGWNCLGNPYTSAILVNSNSTSSNNFINSNSDNLDPSYGSIYLWEQGNNSYTIVRLADAAYYTAVGQGFFVKAKTGATQVSFAPTMQSHQTNATFKSSNIEWPQIKLEAYQGDKSNTARVMFNNAMGRGLDFGYDAGIMRTGFDVYTKLAVDNGVDFGIQCLPLNESEGVVIPVGIESNEAGTVELLVTASNLPKGFVASLEDRQRGILMPITDEGVNLEVAQNGTLANRFFLHVGNATSVGRVSDWGKRINVLQGNGKITVSGIDGGGCTATLYDVQGRKLQKAKLANNYAISTQGLVNGIYLLEVKQQGNVTVKRISVNN